MPAAIVWGGSAVVLLLVGLSLLMADPPPPEVAFSVKIVSDLSDEIKTCKASLYEERRWGNKPDQIERDYLDTPANVIWDAKKQDSMRAPYLAYIEFTSHFFTSVPPSSREKYEKLIGFVPIMHLGEWYFRYEFDVGPTTVKFSRAFVKYPSGHAATDPFPTGSEPFSRNDMCWDRWLRQDGEYRSPK
jgi:hypothetical protein